MFSPGQKLSHSGAVGDDRPSTPLDVGGQSGRYMLHLGQGASLLLQADTTSLHEIAHRLIRERGVIGQVEFEEGDGPCVRPVYVPAGHVRLVVQVD